MYMTKGRKSQSMFDALISDMSISSLSFLMHKYRKDIEELKSSKDYDYKQLQELKQRYNMVKEELEFRFRNKNLIDTDVYFVHNHDDVIVVDSNGRQKRYAILVSPSGIKFKEMEEVY